MDKISVIIPVYNAESYIKKCLDSVINQTHTNLEILCVDDGSTDNSGKICDEYAEKDSRIKVFHKENGGDASARNAGLRNFTGKYVGFVDSDDWIEPDMYEVLYNLIKEKNVSVSVCGIFTVTDKETIPRKNINQITDGLLSQRDMLTYIYRLDLYNNFHVVVWNKLYSAKLFRKNNELLFAEKLKSGSDVLFMSSVFLTNNCTGAYTDKHLYHHYIRETSLVRSSSVNVKINGSLTAHKIVIDLFNKNGYNDLTMLVKKEICYYASLIAELAVKNNDGIALERMKAEMKNCFSEYAEVQKEFPKRIERIKKLIGFENGGRLNG
ncbi:MAG: glycosyltransferase [Chitinispirillales bacterium]|jgi:glycosyltransferase involved in cell wall biosynthesis|nr:glycosyltransferase [Chitinispirillales bacterium]